MQRNPSHEESMTRRVLRGSVGRPFLDRMSPDDEYPGLGQRIRDARLVAGLSQRKLATTLDTDKSSIWKWEKAGAVPGTHHLEGLCAALGVTRAFLLYGHQAMPPQAPDPPYAAWRAFLDTSGSTPEWVMRNLRAMTFEDCEPSTAFYPMAAQLFLTGTVRNEQKKGDGVGGGAGGVRGGVSRRSSRPPGGAGQGRH